MLSLLDESTSSESMGEDQYFASDDCSNIREPTSWKDGLFIGNDSCIRSGTIIRHKDGTVDKISIVICEGYVYIDREIKSISDNENIFILKVKPKNGEESELEIRAYDIADGRKISGLLSNVFGSDSLGKLNIDAIKYFSDHPLKTITLFKKPQWYHNKIMAPGLGIKDADFKFTQKVVVDFDTNGDHLKGLAALDNIVKGFNPKHAVIGITTFLGAPVIGKVWDGDRFGLFIQATTGFMKTAFVNLVAPLYGQGYSLEGNLLRWGQGTTANAAGHIAVKCGPFNFILDNYKEYTKESKMEITKLIHGILEGSEKARMQQNTSDLRESDPYLCTPIITGENYPGEDAATRARIILLKWERPKDLEAITKAQNHIADINALGKKWIQWLSSESGKVAIEYIAGLLVQERTDYLKKVKDSVNAGRIATNAAILSLIWELMKICPYTKDWASKYDDTMRQAINDHILEASEEVNANTEAEKFISWLRSALETNQFYISGLSNSTLTIDKQAEAKKAAIKTHIGTCKNDEILITPDVLDNTLLPAWMKVNQGVQVDKRSLRRQLYEHKYIKYDVKNKQYTYTKYIDGRPKKVFVFSKAILLN